MWLRIQSGEQAGTSVEITKSPFVIGREEGCDHVLADEKASRRHAQLEPLPDGRAVLTDLGSTNGTFVNGVRITAPVVLEGGEEVRFADTVFAAVGVQVEAPPAAPGERATVAAAVPSPPAPPVAPAYAPPPAPSVARRLVEGRTKWVTVGAIVAVFAGAGAGIGIALSGGGEKAATTVPVTTAAPPTTAPVTTAPVTTEGTATVPVVSLGIPMAYASDADGDFEIYYQAADGTVTQLTNNTANDDVPALSPDGSRIAFESDVDGDWDVYVVNVDGSGLTQLANEPGIDGGPGWSPDGGRIAFHSDRDGDYEIWTMNADGSSQTQLTANSTWDANPQFSPDPSADRIVYQADPSEDGNDEIYVVNGDGSGITPVTTQGDSQYPSWSSDGTRIAVGSNVSGDWEVVVGNADGSSFAQVTSSPGIDGYPRWLPDGRLAFHSSRNGDANWDIFVVNPDGTGLGQITTGTTNDADPSFALGGGGGGTGTDEGGAFPNADESGLLAHVPDAFRTSCERQTAENQLPDALAGVFCAVDANIGVYYNLFPDQATMTAQYDSVVQSYGATRDSGDCTTDAVSESRYTISGEDAGRYVCFDLGSARHLAWTDDAVLIRSDAYHTGGDKQALYDFWLNEAGPVR